LLEIGCAAGFMLDSFVAEGWSGVGVEPNETMARYGREHLGLDVRVGTAERYPPLMTPVDLVTMIQVIAHVVDIDTTLANARSALVPGGFFLIETWDAWSWTSRLLGRHWHEYSPPSVLRIFTRTSLTRMLAQHGFECIATGRPQKYISSEHAKALLAEKGNDSRLLRLLASLSRHLPEPWILPYPAEDLFWSIFRKV
jgi:SAM-dependent methyltransferase